MMTLSNYFLSGELWTFDMAEIFILRCYTVGVRFSIKNLERKVVTVSALRASIPRVLRTNNYPETL